MTDAFAVHQTSFPRYYIDDIRAKRDGVFEPPNETYVEVGLFKNSTNEDYLMLVSRRCVSTGDREVTLTLNIQDGPIALRDIATPGEVYTSTTGIFEGITLGPGRGKLLKIEHTPVMELSADSHDYGDVIVGTSSDWILPISNSGSEDLDISSAVTHTSDFTVVFADFPQTLQPGDQLPITISFVPTSEGIKSDDLTITSNDPEKEEVDVSLTGRGVKPVLSVPTVDYDFGQVVVGSSLDWDFMISNGGTGDLEISLIFVSSSSDFTLISPSSFPITIPENGSPLGVTVEFTPSEIGERNGTLSVASNDPDAELVEIPLTGTGTRPDVELSATSHDYGQVVVECSVDWTLEVHNGIEGIGDLVINTIVLDDHNDFVITSPHSFPQTIPEGEFLNVEITFTPEISGDRQGNVTITSNDPDEPSVVVSLSGIGVDPEIEFSELSHDYGKVIVDESSEWVLTITNAGGVGQGGLIVYGIISDNDHFYVVPPEPDGFPQMVPKFSSIDIAVLFSPTAVGIESGVLTVTSNDPDEKEVTLSLSGKGVLPVVTSASNVCCHTQTGETATSKILSDNQTYTSESIAHILLSLSFDANLLAEVMFTVGSVVEGNTSQLSFQDASAFDPSGNSLDVVFESGTVYFGRGDVFCDGVINIIDVMPVVNIILALFDPTAVPGILDRAISAGGGGGGGGEPSQNPIASTSHITSLLKC